MNIRGIEVEFDFFDADDIEKFEKESEKVVKKSEESKSIQISMSEAIRKECDIVEEFFDNVFGSGTSQKIFKGKKNLNEHIKAFEDVVNEKIKQQSDLQATFNRYMPNREQRRNNKYKKGRK